MNTTSIHTAAFKVVPLLNVDPVYYYFFTVPMFVVFA